MSLSINVARLVDDSIIAVFINIVSSGFGRSIAVALGNKLLDEFLNYGGQEVSLECCNALRRLRGYKVDTDNTAMRSSAINGNLQKTCESPSLLDTRADTEHGYEDTTYL